MPTHAVVWIDHKEARVFHVHPSSTEETTVLAPQHYVQRDPDDQQQFLSGVARTLEGADAILIVGPWSAKLELYRHLHAHYPLVEERVAGIETADHPTDGQIVAMARQYFRGRQTFATATTASGSTNSRSG